MAHGEMVMIGAYAAYLTQQGLRAYAPGLTDWSVLIALPVSFCVAFLVGVLDRTLRHPFLVRPAAGNPARHLRRQSGVATAVRSLFGPTNREVSAPS